MHFLPVDISFENCDSRRHGDVDGAANDLLPVLAGVADRLDVVEQHVRPGRNVKNFFLTFSSMQ
jgi:hypothetical protein